ncbi:hypothetical protein KP509_36G047100 [Ceratopteris richardii]|uniref:RING-type E3 ubiquitin transferase n=1 Tax=Ceratopteris richardii TaxID=49495 RepID=A0A8T2QBD4_CERRI|nr:hypothetical protein KP509_36G047100 [Ceratopteris richardii]KAH7281427.1 hypothetical protein KP509_36G047100 [Ceratopteris richardii]KAH7281428.1 hypothetical protein KP509_36G047100 [Ceratopteris richardii]KAH7281429.1 hypothetical protein KP509_36G047100 [Ceratopteris richardii]KAH7281430.1 hypothetical protein KP509_36G047100 [Ceratopteris richardii]
MGNASCSRRTQQSPVHSSPPGYPNPHVSPVGPVPQYYNAGENSSIPPNVRRNGYPQGHWPTNGQHFMNIQSGQLNPVLAQEGIVPPRLNPPVAEQKVVPIRNEVNVNKSTLRLKKDEENPGYHLVAFTFDAIVPGSICIFFHAKEGRDFSLIPIKREFFEPVRVPFQEGLGQKFVQPPGTGVNLSLLEPSDLFQVKEGDIYPLVVRIETRGGDSATNDCSHEAGAPLLKSVGAQTTSCVLEMKDHEYCVRVIKQIIWVEGMRYELQEIYGIETVDGGNGSIDSSDFGKECVVCLSEHRDTTVLPCRHMCMCRGCAKLLQERTNRCPICRTRVLKLLEIEIPKRENST